MTELCEPERPNAIEKSIEDDWNFSIIKLEQLHHVWYMDGQEWVLLSNLKIWIWWEGNKQLEVTYISYKWAEKSRKKVGEHDTNQ